MQFLEVNAISKQQRGIFVVKDVSFNQQRSQKIAIAGETGSGKSTLLRIIAGLEQADTGEVWFEGIKVIGPEEKLIPGHPGIAYLSQQFELRNNYRVEEVLDYANKLSNEEAALIYEICRINHLLQRRTDQVSGGEKQRIAIARLLISSPRLLLLDEPYSNLDMIHKTILKSVIQDLGEMLKISCILISHDPIDTLSWADELIVMKDGKILQQGLPEQIYRQPVDEYTGGLFGKYNLVDPSESMTFSRLSDSQTTGKKRFIRPESFTIVAKETNIKGNVQRVTFAGSSYEIDVLVSNKTLTVKSNVGKYLQGDTVFLSLSPDDVWYL